MADLGASILVVLGVTWVVGRVMDAVVRRPTTAAMRRCWVFVSLLSSIPVMGVLAGLDVIGWRGVAVPAVLLVLWVVVCRETASRRRGAPGRPQRTRGRVIGRRSPATFALVAAAIVAWWVAVNPMGSRPNEAVAATAVTADEWVPGQTLKALNGAQDRRGTKASPSRLGVSADGAGRPIVMATRGAIIYVGDQGRLTANTGATSSSGNVALGVQRSDLRSGDSGAAATAARQRPTAARSSRMRIGHENSTLAGLAKWGKGPRGTAMSGFEDHSVSVLGDDQIVTYDDSNVFIDRKGLINANTGDTDSSGLNAVDVGASTVRAGNSGDSEGGGDDEAEEEEPVLPPAVSGARKLRGSRITPHAGGTGVAPDPDDAEEDDAEESGDGAAAVGPARGKAFGTVTDEGASIATGKNAFVVGADGVDDVSIRSRGRNDIVTYDDSNVTIGGEGKVNAQIGDSDTGGAVVMGIDQSDVRAGCEGDLCYSSNPAIRMAAQLLGSSGVRLTPVQWRQLVAFVARENTPGQSAPDPSAPARHRGRPGR